ncbi:hypothetical protein KKC1_16200 [Calderihabitans maritimus]|uniref:Uncharacterized protein n=1 Tax=Calderihabitans maritimus TaxID=1246530 RepID=A0A1Z5HSG2_9FIRM|nr:hypothetical protein KKC1_16200 [Calderihabitans maritimus]
MFWSQREKICRETEKAGQMLIEKASY